MKMKPMVARISVTSRTSISLLKSMRSMTMPMSGASMTAGSIAMAAVRAMVTSSAPKETSMEKMATCENHVPK